MSNGQTIPYEIGEHVQFLYHKFEFKELKINQMSRNTGNCLRETSLKGFNIFSNIYTSLFPRNTVFSEFEIDIPL